MLNIEQILTEFNVEIPDGKKEEFVKKVLEILCPICASFLLITLKKETN